MKQRDKFQYKLGRFERYFKRQNFDGSYFHLKGNILRMFREIFEEDLKNE